MNTLRVLIPLDETPISIKAVDVVHNMARTIEHCDVELLHVEWVDGPARTTDREVRVRQAQDFLAHEAGRLAAPNIETTRRVAWGNPERAILARVREAPFDFICLASGSDPSDLNRRCSVTASLLASSPVPVIALPPDAPGCHREPAQQGQAPAVPAAGVLPPNVIFSPIRARSGRPAPVTERDVTLQKRAREAQRRALSHRLPDYARVSSLPR